MEGICGVSNLQGIKKRFLLFSILLLLTLPGLSAMDYFRSNALGMKLERINEFRIDEFEYVLTVEVSGDRVIRNLLSNGELVRTWIIMEEPNGDVLEEEIVGEERTVRRRSEGRIVRETKEIGGAVDEVREYFYDGGNLRHVDVSGPEGLRFSDRFERTGDGRLRKVVRDFPDGRRMVSQFSSGTGGLAEEVHISGTSSTRFRYEGSDLAVEETWSGGELVSKIEYFPDTHSSLETDVVSGRTIRREYDDQDRVIHEVIETEAEQESSDYIYEGDELKTEIRRSGGTMEKWVYSYGPDGEKASFEYFRDKVLIKRRIFESEGTFTDIIMREGRPMLIVYYEGYTEIRSEFVGIGTSSEEESMQ